MYSAGMLWPVASSENEDIFLTKMYSSSHFIWDCHTWVQLLHFVVKQTRSSLFAKHLILRGVWGRPVGTVDFRADTLCHIINRKLWIRPHTNPKLVQNRTDNCDIECALKSSCSLAPYYDKCCNNEVRRPSGFTLTPSVDWHLLSMYNACFNNKKVCISCLYLLCTTERVTFCSL